MIRVSSSTIHRRLDNKQERSHMRGILTRVTLGSFERLYAIDANAFILQSLISTVRYRDRSRCCVLAIPSWAFWYSPVGSLSAIQLNCSTYCIILALVRVDQGLECYACESCSDPFDASNAPVIVSLDNDIFNCTVRETLGGGESLTVCLQKEHTQFGVHRGASRSCHTTNSTEQWCCQTDLCNAGVALSKARLTHWSFLIVVFKEVVPFFE